MYSSTCCTVSYSMKKICALTYTATMTFPLNVPLYVYTKSLVSSPCTSQVETATLVALVAPHRAYPTTHSEAKKSQHGFKDAYCTATVWSKNIISKITTDVGLEPTASALGGLRATIAPTGHI
jgi:hypothetical protein